MALQTEITSNLEGTRRVLEEAQKTYSPQNIRRAATVAGRVTGVRAEALVREYPLPPNGRPRKAKYLRYHRNKQGRFTGGTFMSKWKTPKQQGYVFGVLLKNGSIPYVRKGTLGRTITSSVAVSEDGSDVDITVGSSASHSEYVIGDEQAEYHKDTGWKRLSAEIQANRTDLDNTFVTTFRTALKKLSS